MSKLRWRIRGFGSRDVLNRRETYPSFEAALAALEQDSPVGLGPGLYCTQDEPGEQRYSCFTSEKDARAKDADERVVATIHGDFR